MVTGTGSLQDHGTFPVTSQEGPELYPGDCQPGVQAGYRRVIGRAKESLHDFTGQHAGPLSRVSSDSGDSGDAFFG
jgi:hypothetical protein